MHTYKMSTHSFFVSVVDDTKPGPMYALQVPITIKMKVMKATMVILFKNSQSHNRSSLDGKLPL